MIRRFLLLTLLLPFQNALYATPAEGQQLTALETRLTTLIDIIDTHNKKVSDSWWVDTNPLQLGADLTIAAKNVGPIHVQDLLEGLANAHNERFSKTWLLKNKARECLLLMLEMIKNARTLIEQRNPSYNQMITDDKKVITLERLKSRINVILFALRDNSPLARSLYHGNWLLPSPEHMHNVPHAGRITWSMIGYNMLPKSIITRPILTAILEQLKIAVIRALQELKRK